MKHDETHRFDNKNPVGFFAVLNQNVSPPNEKWHFKGHEKYDFL